MPGEEDVRRIALELPRVEERSCYGTQAWFVKGGRLFARMQEDGRRVVVKVDPDEREAMLRSDPATYELTPHYQDVPMVIVRLHAVDPVELEEVLTEAWRRSAPKRLLAQWDATHPVAAHEGGD